MTASRPGRSSDERGVTYRCSFHTRERRSWSVPFGQEASTVVLSRLLESLSNEGSFQARHRDALLRLLLKGMEDAYKSGGVKG